MEEDKNKMNGPEGDVVAKAAEKARLLSTLFDTIKKANDFLSAEELELALESLKLASFEIREREEAEITATRKDKLLGEHPLHTHRELYDRGIPHPTKHRLILSEIRESSERMCGGEYGAVILETHTGQLLQDPNIIVAHAPRRRTVGIHLRTDHILYGSLRPHRVLHEHFPRKILQQFMLIGMATDMMPLRIYLTDQFGMMVGHPSQAEECGGQPSSLQLLQYLVHPQLQAVLIFLPIHVRPDTVAIPILHIES